MRVYLTEAKSVTTANVGGAKVTRMFHAGAFFNVDESTGRSWIAKGVAFEASEDNKVAAYKAGDKDATMIDIDAGGDLVGLRPSPFVLPSPAAAVAEKRSASKKKPEKKSSGN